MLGIRPVHPAESGLLAQARARAVRSDDQRSPEMLAALKVDADRASTGLDALDARMTHRHPGIPAVAEKRPRQHGPLDHVGERLARLNLAREGEERRPHGVLQPAVGDDYLDDRLRLRL